MLKEVGCGGGNPLPGDGAVGSCQVGTSDPSSNPEGGLSCGGCGREIAERWYLRAADRAWHCGCLRCCHCRLPLAAELTCFARDGNIYCKEDYYRIASPQRALLVDGVADRLRRLGWIPGFRPPESADETHADKLQTPSAQNDEELLCHQPEPGRKGPQTTGSEDGLVEARPPGLVPKRPGKMAAKHDATRGKRRGRRWRKLPRNTRVFEPGGAPQCRTELRSYGGQQQPAPSFHGGTPRAAPSPLRRFVPGIILRYLLTPVSNGGGLQFWLPPQPARLVNRLCERSWWPWISEEEQRKRGCDAGGKIYGKNLRKLMVCRIEPRVFQITYIIAIRDRSASR
ncbi:uncharacterized protein LOC124405664 isoform X2 [Diprion similis]|uniref:uncharacterized protein LOC124405664 isoform X2 n=1 Tax=Diprion similis TaxID=362088 RepID=UPI001EF85B14|nr:uncharacterized protein LOC124405664 isoform X2 [Diprion similis]